MCLFIGGGHYISAVSLLAGGDGDVEQKLTVCRLEQYNFVVKTVNCNIGLAGKQ